MLFQPNQYFIRKLMGQLLILKHEHSTNFILCFQLHIYLSNLKQLEKIFLVIQFLLLLPMQQPKFNMQILLLCYNELIIYQQQHIFLIIKIHKKIKIFYQLYIIVITIFNFDNIFNIKNKFNFSFIFDLIKIFLVS